MNKRVTIKSLLIACGLLTGVMTGSTLLAKNPPREVDVTLDGRTLGMHMIISGKRITGNLTGDRSDAMKKGKLSLTKSGFLLAVCQFDFSDQLGPDWKKTYYVFGNDNSFAIYRDNYKGNNAVLLDSGTWTGGVL